MDDDKKPESAEQTKKDKTVLVLGVVWIADEACTIIREDGLRFFEADSVLARLSSDPIRTATRAFNGVYAHVVHTEQAIITSAVKPDGLQDSRSQRLACAVAPLLQLLRVHAVFAAPMTMDSTTSQPMRPQRTPSG